MKAIAREEAQVLLDAGGVEIRTPHWGYVLTRRIGLRTKDGEEVYEAGQAFYWSPGHAPKALEDSEYVEFLPTSGLTELFDHIRPQLA